MIYCSTGSDEALTLKCLAVHCNIVRVSSCRLYSDESDDSGPSVPALLKIPPIPGAVCRHVSFCLWYSHSLKI